MFNKKQNEKPYILTSPKCLLTIQTQREVSVTWSWAKRHIYTVATMRLLTGHASCTHWMHKE